MHLCANFLITSDFFQLLSTNFQSVVSGLGEYVSCDEKLDLFTGNSGDIRKCPNKPAHIGLWHYQMVAKINEEIPCILDVQMAKIDKPAGEAEVMANVIGHWADVVVNINRNTPRKHLCASTRITWIPSPERF
jgi:hypothetical protein